MPSAAHSAPIGTTTHHWPASGSAVIGRFKAQVSSSQSNTAGSAPADPAASSSIQDCKPVAWKLTAIATTACTNSSARNTTPTWHTSNSACAGRAASPGPAPNADGAKLDETGSVKLSEASVCGSAKVVTGAFAWERAACIGRA